MNKIDKKHFFRRAVYVVLIPSILFSFYVLGQKKIPSFLSKYSILNKKINDTRLKTEVDLDILILDRRLRADELKDLLKNIYFSIRKRGGFKYHKFPTNVRIYAFFSKRDYGLGRGQWVAFLSKGFYDTVPRITINEWRIFQIDVPRKVKYGLKESQRKYIWREINRIREEAFKESERICPGYNNTAGRKDALRRKLLDEYMDELSEKYKLPRSVLEDIMLEGVESEWLLPDSFEKGQNW